LAGETWPDYWSLSVYQQNSDNIFVVNDRELPSPEFHVVISRPRTGDEQPEAPLTVESPTDKGIVLIRRFVASADRMDAVRDNQDAMTCGTRADNVTATLLVPVDPKSSARRPISKDERSDASWRHHY